MCFVDLLGFLLLLLCVYIEDLHFQAFCIISQVCFVPSLIPYHSAASTHFMFLKSKSKTTKNHSHLLEILGYKKKVINHI